MEKSGSYLDHRIINHISSSVSEKIKKEEILRDKEAKISDEELIKIRKEKIIMFLKTRYNWISYLVLAFIVYLAVKIRTKNLPGLRDITTGTWTLGPDLDPFLALRWAKYIVEHGSLFAVDTMRYVPLGFNMGGEYLLWPYSIAWFHKIAVYFGSESVTHSAVLYPVFFFALTVIAFFLMTRKMFSDSVGERNANIIALIASFFLTAMPALLPRTIAGIPEKESAAFFFMFLALYFFLASWKSEHHYGKYVLAVLGGAATAGMAHIWGGYAFIFYIISPAVFVAFLLGQMNKEKTTLYATWLFSALILMILPFERHTLRGFLSGTSGSFTMAVLFIALINFALLNTALKKYFNSNKLSKIPPQIISIVLSVIMLSVIATLFFGPSFIPSQINNVLDTLIKPATSRLIQTVAENRQPYFGEWVGSFGPYYKGIPITFWLFFFGSVYLFRSSIKGIFKKKETWSITFSYVVLLSAVIFSRYSPNSTFNGENFASKFVYTSGFVLFLIVFGFYYYRYYKNNESEKLKQINFGFLLLFLLFFLGIVGARAAVRGIMVLVPAASIIVAYFAVASFNDAIKDKKGFVKNIRWILAVVVVLLLLFAGNGYYNAVISSAGSHVPSIYTQQWQKAMAWVRENTQEDAVFGHWWDYGYWLQSIGERATVLDGGNAISYWNHLMGRHALTGTSNQDALEFLYAHNTTHFLIDSSDIGKYGAFSSIGSDVNYDRASYIPTFQKYEQGIQEMKNSTIQIYQGGAGLDEDVIYEDNGTKIFLPAGQAGIGAVLVERRNADLELMQPKAIFVYQGQQYTLPLRYAHDGKQFYDFENGVEAGFFIFPRVIQSGGGIQIDQDGAMLYLSRRTVKSQLARLYLYKEDNPYFELAHSEDDFFVSQIKAQNPEFDSDFVLYQGLRGPIRIWKINYPDNITLNEEFLNTVYPEEILYAR